MILVDIGNSGLRACRIVDEELFSDQEVFRLSWSASVASRIKPSPEQESEPNQRWCSIDDVSAFEWLASRFHPHRNDTWMISCVQRTALEQLHRAMKQHGLVAQTHVVSFPDLPMKLNLESPEKTGIDRLLAAFAAREILNPSSSNFRPVIVVQAGTAVTVDLVDIDGVFQGGAIMPGLGLSLQLLAAGTDQLPWLGNHLVETQPPLPGKNTTQAISAGVNAALVGGAAHLVRRYRQQLASFSNSSVQVMVTGGDGKLLVPHIEAPSRYRRCVW